MNLHCSWNKKDKRFRIYSIGEWNYDDWVDLYFKKNTWLNFTYRPYGYDSPYKNIIFGFWFFDCFLYFPFFKDKKHPHGEETDCEEAPEYGFTFWDAHDTNPFFADDVHLHWGKKSRIIDLPWCREGAYRYYPDHKEGVKYEVIFKSNKKHLKWITDDMLYDKSYDTSETLDKMNYHTFDFTHKCRSGLIQHTKAFVYEEVFVDRPKMFMWTSLFDKKTRRVEIIFETPVGDPDTWKGPTYSVSTPFHKGENTVEDVVRRIEKTLVTH